MNKKSNDRSTRYTWITTLAVIVAVMVFWLTLRGQIQERPPRPTQTVNPVKSTPTRFIPPEPTNTFVRVHESNTPTVTPFPVVTKNSDWNPRFQTFDGVEMVLVPPGCFTMGLSASEIAKWVKTTTYYSADGPQFQLCFDKPFWIDKYEVTNEQFARFNGKAALRGVWRDDQRPRENVTWTEARDFCASRGVDTRLPTEAEWEYAARGPDGLLYPWGNEFVNANVILYAHGLGSTSQVGNRPENVSWVGALDMAGNVAEWTSSILDPQRFPYPYRKDDGREDPSDEIIPRVIRGGSFESGPDLAMTHRDFTLRSNYRLEWIGIRCVRDYSPVPVTATPSITPLPTATFIPIVTPVPAITANDQWQPHFQLFNNIEMALVPPGCFMMGSTQQEIDRVEQEHHFASNQGPQTHICFSKPYWIDKTEITQSQFIEPGGKPDDRFDFAGDSRPAYDITWFEARDYCAKQGGRLPTEAEWEYAARGPDDLLYPWGNEFDANKLILNRPSQDEGPVEVGSKPEGASWVGALDMLGNVGEWTSTLYRSYPYYEANYVPGANPDKDTNNEITFRGGTWWWNTDDSNISATSRSSTFPDYTLFRLGFRCARDFDQK